MVPPNARTTLFPRPQTAWILLILAAMLAVSAARAGEPCGLLWRVDPPAAAPSYLFGTIHSEDPRVLTLGEPVKAAFNSADTFVMELIPDLGSTQSVFKQMYFQDQRNLKSVLDGELYRKAVHALAERGVGEGIALKMKPWAVAVTLSFPRPESGMFLDLMLYNRAIQADKRTVGLEHAEEQLTFFTGLSMKEQIELLRATLDNTQDLQDSLEKLIQAYLSRDPGALEGLDSRYMADLPEDLAGRFRREAIIQRNHRMLERMSPEIAAGNAFIAVGALHLYGPQGLISLLRQDGEDVQCVY